LFIVLRNSPAERGLVPLPGRGSDRASKSGRDLSRGRFAAMFISVALLGSIANPGFAHISILYSSEGFSLTQASLAVSVMGAFLTLGKFMYGVIADRVGGARTSLLFYAISVISLVLCSMAGVSGFAVAVLAQMLLGFGMALTSTGFAVFATDMSSAGRYPYTIKMFQTAYLVGALLFGPVPGMIADFCGSYIPFFMMITVFCALSMAITRLTYRSVARAEHTGPEPAAVIKE
ncbi:MAG: MFS transporter, partial [Oscillospiraceae bacterium]|nr:MFS transporter [Oscillospiraceae bacterium]